MEDKIISKLNEYLEDHGPGRGEVIPESCLPSLAQELLNIMGEAGVSSECNTLLCESASSQQTVQNAVDGLFREIKKYGSFCDRLFKVRYEEAKPEDAWYDERLQDYHRAKARIEVYCEILGVAF